MNTLPLRLPHFRVGGKTNGRLPEVFDQLLKGQCFQFYEIGSNPLSQVQHWSVPFSTTKGFVGICGY